MQRSSPKVWCTPNVASIHQLNYECDRWPTTVALMIATIALGYALQISDGTLHPEAVRWLSVAFIVCTIGIIVPAIRTAEWFGEQLVAVVASAGLAFQFWQLLTMQPGIYLQISHTGDYLPFFSGLMIAAVLVALSILHSAWRARIWLPLLLLTHFMLGVWLIKTSPDPFIDVYVFQRDASNALLQGINPYVITFPDIYGGDSPFYGPGLSVDGRLTFGFPYPPFSLLLALPGHILGGDHRYSQLAAMTLAGALMAYARLSRLGVIGAGLFLFTPRIFFVLEQGWTEPFLVLFLAAIMFCFYRAPNVLPFTLGLFLATKQYLIFALPVVLLLMPRPLHWSDVWGWFWKISLVVLTVSLPLILWNVSAFVHSVVTLQVYQPFRTDALSYLAWSAQAGDPWLPQWLAFAAVIPAIALSLWKGARSPAGFAAAIALIYFAFFAFNKQAFCNYYFFVVGALCCAVAAMQNAPLSNDSQ
jgi:hypothetical protein